MNVNEYTIEVAKNLIYAQRHIFIAQQQLAAAQADYERCREMLPKSAFCELSAIGLPAATVKRLNAAAFTYVYQALLLLRPSAFGYPDGIGEGTVRQLKAAIERLGETSS